MSTIPLAKPYDPSKLHFPVYVSEKLDGVPVRIDDTVRGATSGRVDYRVQSRQGKPVPSVQHLALMLAQRCDLCLNVGEYTFVAEVTHTTFTDFKDISGAVRQHVQNDDLILNVFDFDLSYPERTQFDARISFLRQHHNSLFDNERIKLVVQRWCPDAAALDEAIELIMALNPNAEGAVARSFDAPFKPGARHWDYQKIVQDPSCDLRLHSVEEAISKTGEPLGMVGRLNFWFKGDVIGVGPGKLDHAARRDLWQQIPDVTFPDTCDEDEQFTAPIAKVQYKRDPSYTALRQPTFQCWRDDKTEVSYD